MRIGKILQGITENQRGTLLLWLPFALAIGIAEYFALTFEPTSSHYTYIVGIGILTGMAAWRTTYILSIPFTATCLIATGFLVAGSSAHQKSAPILKYHYYGPVTGRIIKIDRSSSNKLRISLADVLLRNIPPEKTPGIVRISLHSPQSYPPLNPGGRVMITASLSPPAGPAEPHGFDFQRLAWFRELGAVGYSRTPLLEFAPPVSSGFSIRLSRLRLQLAEGIRSRIKGQNGAFAAAILTGDRIAIKPEILEKLRASNLAHLLAISGLHMGLLTGFVFAAIRFGLAANPYLALRLPLKKIAAIGAFLAALCYLFLSGANVATQRAFVMVAVMLLAIMLDRRAATMRAVALAAVIVLILRPESLIEAGFQMSFAATTALVAVFAVLRDMNFLQPRKGLPNTIFRWAFALILSSAIAGLATAPISAFHFNQIAKFGLMANLASVPVMGFLVMPAAVVAILLTPLGLDGVFWSIMGGGIGWIMSVAETISSLQGSVLPIVKPPTFVLSLITAGMLGLFLLRGRVRLVALIPVIFGFLFWSEVERPSILLSPNGRLLGVLGKDGRALNRLKGTGFAAQNWLENDGDNATRDEAYKRFESQRDKDVEVIELGAKSIVYQWDKEIDADSVKQMCRHHEIVIVPQSDISIDGCVLVNKSRLRQLGTISIDVIDGQLKIKGARQTTGTRLWSNK